MKPTYQLTLGRQAANALVGAAARLGLGPSGTRLLSVRGRRSGTTRTTPVSTVDEGGERWLVAPYGAVAWVHNARAARQVSLRRGRRRERFAVEEVDGAESAPVLRAYIRQAPIVRPYFEAGPQDSLEAFAAEADRHPVFRLREMA